MREPSRNQNSGRTQVLLRRQAYTIAMALFVLLAFAAGSSYAAAPAANSQIGNKATAAYNFQGSVVPQSAESNTVLTTVQQVAGLTLTADATVVTSPASTADFSHVLTNTGNGTDTYALLIDTLVPNGIISSVTIYSDPALTNVITDLTLTAGESRIFYIRATTLGTATAGDGTFRINATSGHTGTVTTFNADTVRISGNAVVQLTKSISSPSGAAPSGPYTYTLAYTNAGPVTSRLVHITDSLPAGMTYVGGSARWTQTGQPAAVLTDAAGGDPLGIDSVTIDYAAVGNALTIDLNQVLPGAAKGGTITFQVNVDATAPAGLLVNSASYTFNDGSALPGTDITPAAATANFTVNQKGDVVMDDENAAGGAPLSATDSDGHNDMVTIDTAPQGTMIEFDNILTNTGNGTDKFSLAVDAGTFPGGTQFEIWDQTKTTRLDAPGDFTPDILRNGTYHVYVRAILPPAYNGGAGNNNGGAGWTLTLTATSNFNGAESDPVTDKLAAIVPATVDLTNNLVVGAVGCTAGDNTCGYGAGPEGSAVTDTGSVTPVVPGTDTTFTLVINNTSSIADAYTLASGSNDALAALPAGWNVAFRATDGADSCATPGLVLSSPTAAVLAGTSLKLCAVVSVPAGAPAGQQQVYFKATSSNSGATDIKHDAVTVATSRSITFAPVNDAKNIFVDGIYVYAVTVTNNGNVTETAIGLTVADSMLPATGWASSIQDMSDVVINNITLAAGASQTIQIKVNVPATAVLNDANTSTLTLAPGAAGSYSGVQPVVNGVTAPAVFPKGTYVTTFIAATLSLQKAQCLDANCDGVCESGVYTNANIAANPGACVRYQITVTNTTGVTIENIVVSDVMPSDNTATPVQTLFNTGALCPAAGAVGAKLDGGADLVTGGSTVVPANCSTETLRVGLGSMVNNAPAKVITFGVFIPTNP